jgi:hypothetical protein
MRRFLSPVAVLIAALLAGALVPGLRADASVVALGAYHRTGLVPVDGAGLLYNGTGTPRVDTGTHDATGVRMVVYGGRLYDHPVGQAQFGLLNLTSYVRTHDAFYLNRAIAQANRLVARRVVSGGAYFFPYRYPHRIGPASTDVQRVPWYSSMAQGLAVALFCRLYAVTHSRWWLTYAGYAFASLTHGPSSTAPWTTRVDSSGYLWFEEYPMLPPSHSDRTYNGFMFTVIGVYEYWHTTHSATAAALFDGGATTIRRMFPLYRQPGWISRYCLAHPTHVSASYHAIHEGRLLTLYSMTHSSAFAADADLLRYDYPPPASGTVRFAVGTHVGYRFSGSGAVLASRTMTLTRSSQAPADARRRIYGRGIYYHLSDGTLAGYWVLEQRPYRYLAGFAAMHVYTPVRRARLAAGTYSGAKFDASGTSTGSIRVTFAATTSTTVSRSAWVNGYPYALVTAGPLAGTWIGLSRAVALL